MLPPVAPRTYVLKLATLALPVSPTAKLFEFLELLSFGQSFPQW